VPAQPGQPRGGGDEGGKALRQTGVVASVGHTQQLFT
jgi:hypothetical protein